MHPTLAAFADRYRHAFADLTITATPDGEDLRLEWQEGPEAPCCTVTAQMSGGGLIVFVYSASEVPTMIDPIEGLVRAMDRERWWSGGDAPILAAPGTFAALVKERRLLTPPIRPQSPDRLN